MLEICGLLCFGLTVGLYGTLVGIGGGPLIIPMLTLVYDVPPTTIVATSISVVFLNAFSGSLAYYRQRRIDIVSGTVFGLATIPASIGAYFLLARVSHEMFEKVFAAFLLCLAGYVLISRPPAEQPQSGQDARPGLFGPPHNRQVVDGDGKVFRFTVDEGLGSLVNVVFGFVTTMLGIGGGILQVPMLVYLLRMPVHVATATAHYVTAINTCFTLLPLLYFGHADGRLILWLGIGVVLGARIGAWLSPRFRGKTLLRLLSGVFVISALWMLWH